MTNNETTSQLSDRELEVLEKIATGSTNKQIAQELVLSVHTVKVHVRNIHSKLGVSSRTEAAMLALQEGLITIPGINDTESTVKEESDEDEDDDAEADVENATEPTSPNADSAAGAFQSDGKLARPLPSEHADRDVGAPGRQLRPSAAAPPETTETVEPAVSQPQPAAATPPPEPIAPQPTTYLQTKPQPASLSWWQQLYLAGAVLVALGVAIGPVLPAASEPEIYLPPAKSSLNFFPTPVPTTVPPLPANWFPRAPLRSERAALALVAYQDQLFAIGGIGSDNQATPLIESYTPTTDQWAVLATKPTATANIMAAILDDKVYVPGGCDNEGQAVDQLQIYDPADNSWQEGASLPEPRCAYGLVAFQDQLYLFGGWDGQDFRGTVFIFSPKTNEWHLLDQPMPEIKGYMGTAILNNQIYVVGGSNDQQEFNSTHIFDPASGEWTAKAPLHYPRVGLGLVTAANRLYAIGGTVTEGEARADLLTTSEEYDPQTNSWIEFNAPFDSSWRNMGLAAIDTQLYAVGGWNGQEIMDSAVSYQAVHKIFLPLSSFGN